MVERTGQLPPQPVIQREFAVDLVLVLREHRPGRRSQVPRWRRRRQLRRLRDSEQEIRISESGVSAREVVSAVNQRGDGNLVQPVPDRVEPELHEVASLGPAQVIDPLQRGAGIVEQVVTVCVPIKISHRVDPENRRVVDSGGGYTLDTELLDQIAADHVEVIVVPMIGRARSKFVHQRW